jgi:hypothetical protein
VPSDRQQGESPLAVGFFRKYREFTAMFFALPMHLAYNPAESGFNQDRGTPSISRDDFFAERRSRRAKWTPALPNSGEFDTVHARPNGKRSGYVRHEIPDGHLTARARELSGKHQEAKCRVGVVQGPSREHVCAHRHRRIVGRP